MPELPEVESTRRHLAPVLEGAVIERVEVRRDRMARRNQRPSDVVDRLSGRRVTRVGRRGKFLVIDVSGDITWVMHLGMSGRMEIADPGDPERPHTNVVVATDGGLEVRLVDPRTFGFVAAFTPDELPTSGLGRIGPDALDDPPTGPRLAGLLAGRTAPVKALLLDQRLLAGLGNIYADEVLFRAGIHPATPGGSVGASGSDRLAASVVPVLEDGIAHGGTSLDDLAYLLPDGRAGEYLDRLSVYGRTGLPCRRCGTPIERSVIAQRSTHFCPTCQPLPDWDA